MKKMNTTQKIPHRFFWNWDHSTNWCLNERGAQNCGVANPYLKEGSVFEKDFKRVIDWCSLHQMDAVGIVGLLRDVHGGTESARRLCEYANERGVQVYMIAGLFAYGGIYHEGDHKYSLNRFFEKNPECIGTQPDGSKLIVQYQYPYGCGKEPQGCPSHPALHDFVLESLDWLFKEIPELGGIQMESGDSGVCKCDLCRARRGSAVANEPLSIADMAGIYPDAADVIRQRKKDALIICETYHHFLDPECRYFDTENPSADLQKLLNMPESTFWQWKCDQMLRDHTWEKGAPMLKSMQKFRHVVRAHSGTQWWGGRHTFAVDKIRQQCLLSFHSGLDGVSMFGEASPFHTNSEFNYLALEYFADHPLSTTDDFIKDVMSPLLGGDERALLYYEMAQVSEETWRGIPDAVREIARLSIDVSDADAFRRWQYLAAFLHSCYYEIMQNGGVRMKAPHEADRPDQG